MTDNRLKVLLVEDNPGDARLIEEMLCEVPHIQFEVNKADRLATALAGIRTKEVHAILLDLGLPDSQGHNTFLAAHAAASGVPIIVLTGMGDEELALRVVQAGAQDYLVKGQVDAAVLERAIRYAVERKKAQQALQFSQTALRLSEASFRSLVVNSPFAIFRTNPAGDLLDANPALADMLGYAAESELVGLNLVRDIADPFAGIRIAELFRSEMQFRGIEIPCTRKDRKRINVSLTGRPVGDALGKIQHFEIVAEDVTERRALEAQLRQAQKMESVGRLAGGIAHDFNNLLGVIIGHSEVLEQELHNAELLRSAEEIRKAGERAASLTRQLLAFSRQQVLEPKVLGLNDVVAEMERMLRRLIGEHIQFSTQLDQTLGAVKADQGQIEQVILNLVVNARDAMPNGGKLIIETANVEVDDAYALQHGHISPGSFVLLAVTDTGSGMSAETQSHIFEPFFTTKEMGKGTGLGLATVYGVIKQSGGFIWVYSALGHGTAFKILLPRVEKPFEARGRNTRPEARKRGSETILLVEDDAGLRDLTLMLLAAEGYTVQQASTAEDALRIAAEAGAGHFQLLLTDVIMPGISGLQLADELLVLDRNMKVVFMSGYSEFGADPEQLSRNGRSFLQKPFTRQDLLRKVREALQTSCVPAA